MYDFQNVNDSANYKSKLKGKALHHNYFVIAWKAKRPYKLSELLLELMEIDVTLKSKQLWKQLAKTQWTN